MYNINLALNRPTFMSSVYTDPSLGGAFSASRAVDGNKDPIAIKWDNSCVHSWGESNPWWAVDIGAQISVAGVLFTNRADNYGNALLNRFKGVHDRRTELN